MKKRYKALVSAFVMIMFGLIAICYLMEFTNAWTSYTGREVGSGDETISEEGAIGTGIGDMMINGIKALFTSSSENPILAIIGTVIIGAGALLIGKAGGAQAFAYIIPIVFITIFANIFIFPIAPISGELGSVAGTVSIDIILVSFFNLFLFLAIIDFITGRT